MQTSFLVLLSVCATCAALHHQPTAASAFNKRWRVSAAPVAAFSDFQGADSFSSITQQLGEMAQQGMGMAARGAQDLTPIVQSGAEQAAPVIKSSVMGFAEIAGRTAAKVSMGVEASMPVLGQAAEETLPVLGKAAEEASKVLSKAAETGSQALGSQIRSSLTSEQLAQLDEAARRGGQVGEVVSGVAVKTAKTSTELAKVAAPVVQQGIKVGVEKGALSRVSLPEDGHRRRLGSARRDACRATSFFAAVSSSQRRWSVSRAASSVLCKVAFGRLAAGCARWRMWSHPMPATAA